MDPTLLPCLLQRATRAVGHELVNGAIMKLLMLDERKRIHKNASCCIKFLGHLSAMMFIFLVLTLPGPLQNKTWVFCISFWRVEALVNS